MVTTIWLQLVELDAAGNLQECLLAQGDNTSAIGWLFKSCRLPTTSLYYAPVQFVARKLMQLILDSDHCLAALHLPGSKNVVPDLLSFAGHQRGFPHPLAPDFPDNDTLTRRFHDHIPQLIPSTFAICDIPNEISCFISRALQIAESSWNRNKKTLTKNGTEHGDAGLASAPNRGSRTISSTTSPHKKESSSFDPSSPATESLIGTRAEPLMESVRSQWSRVLSETPQAMWVRRSGVTTNAVPFTSRTATSYSHLSESS